MLVALTVDRVTVERLSLLLRFSLSPDNEFDCGDKLNRAKSVTCYVTVLSRLSSQLNGTVEQIPVVNGLLVNFNFPSDWHLTRTGS